MEKNRPGITRKEIEEEIEKLRGELNTLVRDRKCRLDDPEVYEQSCIIDVKIVELMKKGIDG